MNSSVYFSNLEIKDITINEIIKKIKKKDTQKNTSSIQGDFLTSKINISSEKSIKINGEDYVYRILNLYTEREKDKVKDDEGNILDRAFRINITEGKALIYEKNQQVHAIFLKGITTAKILKKDIFDALLDVNSILKENDFNEDFLYWIYYHDYKKTEDIKIKVDDKEITIKNIGTYVGTSQDEKNKIKSEGLKTSSLLATLGNIFSSDKVKKLKFDCFYQNIQVELEININGSYRINTSNCFGDYEDFSESVQVDFLIIYLTEILLLSLKKAYSDEKINEKWMLLKKHEFMETLGEEITLIVKERQAIIKDEIEKLKKHK